MNRFVLQFPFAPADDEAPQSGGSKPPAAAAPDADELTTLRAKVAQYDKDAAEQKAAMAKADREAQKTAGEWDKIVSRHESEMAELRKQLDEAVSALDSHRKQDRQRALTAAVAAKLGLPVDPVLIGLLPQTGEDIAPEKLTDATVARVADAVRKLAPNLRPPQRGPGGPAGASPAFGPDSDEYWRNRGASQSGRKA